MNWANKSIDSLKYFYFVLLSSFEKPGVALIDSKHATLAVSSLPFARLMQCIKVTLSALNN